jgi:hypothetical protein
VYSGLTSSQIPELETKRCTAQSPANARTLGRPGLGLEVINMTPLLQVARNDKSALLTTNPKGETSDDDVACPRELRLRACLHKRRPNSVVWEQRLSDVHLDQDGKNRSGDSFPGLYLCCCDLDRPGPVMSRPARL